ncbi:LAFA_0B03796g1_1 [Lachancea sp. 'fantastica']|nr:LAFA_0B03796g1_1 [Lachancea sp. 'fantastica']
MKRSFGDDSPAIELKKPQLFTSGSGSDAFRAMLMSARRVSSPSLKESEPRTNCYYCDSIDSPMNCDHCRHSICSNCSLGNSTTCLNCCLNH